MLRNLFKNLGSFGIYLLAFFIPALGLLYWCQLNLFAPYKPQSSEEIVFEVKSDWTSQQIGEALEQAGIIRNKAAIDFVVKYRLTEQERSQLKIPAGEYSLSPGMSPEEIVAQLTQGDLKKYELVIPPGQTIAEVIKLVAQSGVASEEQLDVAFRNPTTMSKLGVPAYIPEGFIVEGKYSLLRSNDPTAIVAKLVEQGNKKLDQGVSDWRKRSAQLGFSTYDILKLASIIEAETQKEEERLTIASLFHNRFRIGLPLQSEAALLYNSSANATTAGNIEELKRSPGPYNTFKSNELPQTPICSPSYAALEAALNPGDTEFLYMMPTGSGYHEFSVSLAQHKEREKAARVSILGEEALGED